MPRGGHLGEHGERPEKGALSLLANGERGLNESPLWQLSPEPADETGLGSRAYRFTGGLTGQQDSTGHAAHSRRWRPT